MSNHHVLKYKMPETGDALKIRMTSESTVVLVAAQQPTDVTPTIWIDQPFEMIQGEGVEKTFVCLGTGHGYDPEELVLMGSAVCALGDLVWHVAMLR